MREKFESRESEENALESAFVQLREQTESFIQENPDRIKKLPVSFKRSVLVALAVLGFAFAPEALHADEPDISTQLDAMSFSSEMSTTKEGLRKTSALDTEFDVKGLPMEVAVSGTYVRGVFIPEADLAVTAKEKGPIVFKTLGEISKEPEGTAIFVGGEADIQMPGQLGEVEATLSFSSGKYIQLSRTKENNGTDPGYGVEIGLQANLQKVLRWLPEGVIYVAYKGGREKGVVLGYTFHLHNKNKGGDSEK